MSVQSSIQSITNKLLALEKEYDLLNFQVDGVYAWQLVRVKVYAQIQYLQNSKNHNPPSNSLLQKLKVFYQRYIVNTLFYNPYLDFSRHEVLVFQSSRKYLVDNGYIDIYTKYLSDELDATNIKHKKYQSSYAQDALDKKRGTTKHLDFILVISRILSRFRKTKFTPTEHSLVKELESRLFETFSVQLDLTAMMQADISRTKVEYAFFNRLIKMKGAREIYLVNFCDRASLIWAAKDNGVDVIEMQHGLMVKEDLIFHFPNSNSEEVAYFPTKFYVWERSINTSTLPLKPENIVEYGNQFLQSRVNKFSQLNKNPTQIAIMSQPSLTTEVSDWLLLNMDKLQGYECIYKLHPIEEPNWREIPALMQLQAFDNVKVVGNELSVYELMASSAWVAGVYSTAVYEATQFDCAVILLDLPGVEMVSQLLSKDRVYLVNPQALLDIKDLG